LRKLDRERATAKRRSVQPLKTLKCHRVGGW
jgi:hypothetical protein